MVFAAWVVRKRVTTTASDVDRGVFLFDADELESSCTNYCATNIPIVRDEWVLNVVHSEHSERFEQPGILLQRSRS